MNRLADETSLYLRQHANNPVDWYPWGPEALARARELDRPIFLSVGYSACHWCHVMEHESFEDEATAAVLNEHFVSVKVDREERPDLDSIYMAALQAMNRGGGGWPMSVFLTPSLKPFHAGTYYPPDDRYAHQGMPSFRRLLALVIEAWRDQRQAIEEQSAAVAEHLSDLGRLGGGGEAAALSPHLLHGALHALRRNFDPVHGGFGTQPKFPHAAEMRLLLRAAERFDSAPALDVVNVTLTKMARGGMYDQLGGGFHRYSVDSRWLVPHFEKMLYDNALLARAYLAAHLKTGDPFYRQVAAETLDYVLREMTDPVGAFYSTQDADSEGEEGKFYVWSDGEIRSLLEPGEADLIARVYGVTEGGNFEGHNILHRTRADEQDAAVLGLSVPDFRTRLGRAKEKLLEARSKRVWPGRDEKILTSWNGLMIAAMAEAGAALGEPRYLEAARRSARFVLDRMRTPDGRLLRTCLVGQPAKLTGYLEDYAYLADALVTLYEAAQEPEWLAAAAGLAEAMLKHFADAERGGFFYTADDHEELIARTKDLQDGSTPSGNSMACTALLRLAALTGRKDFRAAGERTLQAFAPVMEQSPAAVGQMLCALDFHLGPVKEYVIVGPQAGAERAAAAVQAADVFNRVVVAHDPAGEPPAELRELLEGRSAVNGEVTTYVCENRACREPLVGLEALAAALLGG